MILAVGLLLAVGGGASTRLAAEIERACAAVPAPTDRTMLLREEERQGWTARGRDAPAAAWIALGCTRARLELAGVTGREGTEMRSGDSWAVGAIGAMRRALGREAGHPVAGTVLGELALAEPWDGVPKETLPALLADVAAGSRTPAVLRACAELALRARDDVAADRCVRAALAVGVDSTFHLVRRARIAYRSGDSLAGADAFFGAVRAVRNAEDRGEVGWHLQWFLRPGELATWNDGPPADAATWLRDRLATRDARDGRPAGSRLATHFGRLEHVVRHFRLKLPRHVIRAGGIVGSMPEALSGGMEPDAVLRACEPGQVPARPQRFYDRWQQELDDRGPVWMRYGRPDKLVALAPADCGGGGTNRREAWLYRDAGDGQPLLVNFENEAFDGSGEATRLVAGVLGIYFCGIDMTRCIASERAQAAARAGGPPLPPERLERIRLDDQDHIVTATTKDDNTVRAAKRIRTEAAYLRLWDPRTGRPFALMPWAVRLEDLAPVAADDGRRAAQFRLAVRRWSSREGIWSDTSVARRMAFPDTTKTKGSRWLTGALELPAVSGLSVWSLVTSQDDERVGHVRDDMIPPLGEGPVVLSDLVLGSAVQGLSWWIGGESVPLAPLGAVSRDAPMSLYWQVRSDSAWASLRTSIRVFKGDGESDEAALVDLAFDGRVDRGIGAVRRNVDLSRLSHGTWRLEVRLLDAQDRVVARRSARLLID